MESNNNTVIIEDTFGNHPLAMTTGNASTAEGSSGDYSLETTTDNVSGTDSISPWLDLDDEHWLAAVAVVAVAVAVAACLLVGVVVYMCKSGGMNGRRGRGAGESTDIQPEVVLFECDPGSPLFEGGNRETLV